MRVLITGVCGFIGSHILEYHLNQGNEIWGMDHPEKMENQSEDLKVLLNHPNVRIDYGNLLRWDKLKEAVSWAEQIYHMAAVVGVFRALEESIDVIINNIRYCDILYYTISQTKNFPKVLIPSSSCVYGNHTTTKMREDTLLIIESPAFQRSNYAIGKLANESIGLAYYKKSGIPSIITRLFNVIGPRQSGQGGHVIPRFIQQACNNDPISIFGDGKQSRSFSDVRDVVKIFDLLMSNEKSIGEIVNVGSDEKVISIEELAFLIKKLANSDSIVRKIPYIEAYGRSYDDTIRREPDLTKVRSLTHYKNKWTLEKTLQELITKYRLENKMSR